jgi:hypothetical protein
MARMAPRLIGSKRAALVVGLVAAAAEIGAADPAPTVDRPAIPLVVPGARPLPPKAFEGVTDQMTLGQIIERLGPPHQQTGSGLMIFVWRATDGRTFWVATTGGDVSQRPVYAKFQ